MSVIQGNVGVNNSGPLAFGLGHFNKRKMQFQSTLDTLTEACLRAGEKDLLPSRLHSDFVRAVSIDQCTSRLIPGEDNDREGRFFLVPILVQLDEVTGGKLVKKSLRSHPNVVKAMTADPDDPTSTGLYLSLEAS